MRELLRAHRAIAFIVAAFIALASYYSVTTPLLETPDEREHFGFVQFVASGRGLPVQSVDQVVHFAKQEGSQPPLYYWVAAAATFWIDTSDFPALAWENPHYGYNVPGVVNDNKNLFIHTARESFPYTGAVLAVHLARFVSVLFGALAVVFTYLLALEFFARDKALAACAAVVAAFVPQFLFISGAVSNDSAIVACAALALWRMVRALHVPPNAREIFLIGVICGIAALAKVSGLILLGVAFLVIVLHAMPKFSIADFRFSSVAQSAIENRKSKILPSFLLFAFSFLLVSGWWYARNYFLYGEVTGTEMMLKIFGGRSEPITLDLFAAQMREVFETFWVGFGWGNVRAPEWVYGLLAAVSALGGLGLLKFLIFDWRFSIRDSWSLRAIRPKFEIRKPVLSEAKDPKSKILLLLFWLLLVLAALVRWMLVTQAPHGRLFFPALPALAALMVLGWTQILPDRLAEWKASVLPSNRASIFASFAHVLTFASFALALFANLTILAPAYAFPAWLSETAAQNTPNRVEITYANQMKLIGYE
ncbi:MAG: glycosyltransferase family 39 protein, partial [Chloroflexi bacterium]|nr:glycosyltransferase family 39 protein [Chloroflexota bacterium]